MLQAAFGESWLSRIKTLEWYSRFKSGRWSFEDNPHPGRLSTSHTEENVERVREIIHTDQRLTIREVADEVTIAFSMCQKILTEDLQMRRVTANSVPRLLTAEQKDDCMSICTDFHERAQNDPNFKSSVITVDECWVYGMTRKQSICPPSRTRHHLLDWRKRGGWSPMSRPRWLRSSTLTGWFIMSMSLEDRRHIKSSTE